MYEKIKVPPLQLERLELLAYVVIGEGGVSGANLADARGASSSDRSPAATGLRREALGRRHVDLGNGGMGTRTRGFRLRLGRLALIVIIIVVVVMVWRAVAGGVARNVVELPRHVIVEDFHVWCHGRVRSRRWCVDGVRSRSLLVPVLVHATRRRIGVRPQAGPARVVVGTLVVDPPSWLVAVLSVVYAVG